jgi:hypothetical protein
MLEPRHRRAASVLSLAISTTSLVRAEGAQRGAQPKLSMPARTAAPRAALRAPPRQVRRSSFRLPAFMALGVGGLGASGALATGLLASGRYNDPANCTTHCNDDRTISNRTLALTSGILAGVAAAGISAGVVLLLVNPARTEKFSLVPALRLKLSTGKAAAGAVWTF